MSHDHSHHHAPADFGRAFAIGIALNTGFVVFEAIVGFMAGSLALVADAGHNLSDVLGLVLAWGAASLAKRASSARYTYGLKRSTILAALTNAIFLLVSVGAIAWEAIIRLEHPATVEGGAVAWVAGLGILINGGTALLFVSGSKGDLNVRGAFMHMAADAVISLGVMVSGIIIVFTGLSWLDPVVSLVVVAVIVVGTWGLFKESLALAMDSVPESVDPQKVEAFLAGMPGVAGVHHVHIWAISTTEIALTAHVVKTEPTLDNTLLCEIHEELEEHFGIGHTTIQIESPGEAECGADAGHGENDHDHGEHDHGHAH